MGVLTEVVQKGDINELNILSKNKTINLDTDEITSAFVLACSGENTEIVRLLLQDDRVDPEAFDKNGYDAISSAVLHNRTAIVKLLLEDERIDPLGNDYRAMHLAQQKGYMGIVELFLSNLHFMGLPLSYYIDRVQTIFLKKSLLFLMILSIHTSKTK